MTRTKPKPNISANRIPMSRNLTLLISLIALLLAHLHAPAQETRRINYGTTTSVSHLPVWVARDAGLFAKQGLQVEPVHIRGGALITMAIMSGQLQFSGAGAESIVAARIEGGDVVLLACPVYSDPVYLMARPEIKSAAELKGKSTAVTRVGSTTHFYLRAALRHVGLDAEKYLTILQLGAGPEIVSALETGRIAAAALTTRYALPYLERGWPMLVDLSTTDLVYPSSCVASSRNFVKTEPRVVEDFLRAYIGGIQLILKDPLFAEKSFARWLRERDPLVVKKSVDAYVRLFKTIPYVPDKGIENVLTDLATRRAIAKEFFARPELFRDNTPLERALSARP